MKFLIATPEWFISKGVDPTNFRHSLDKTLCISALNIIKPLIETIEETPDYKVLTLRGAHDLMITPEWTTIESTISDTPIDSDDTMI